VHLVGFIIRIYHNAWSSECQIYLNVVNTVHHIRYHHLPTNSYALHCVYQLTYECSLLHISFRLYLSVHILSLALFSRCRVLFVSYSFNITFPSFPSTVVRQTVYSRIHDMIPKYNIKKTTHSILQHFIC
jgi:hypothetical protein